MRGSWRPFVVENARTFLSIARLDVHEREIGRHQRNENDRVAAFLHRYIIMRRPPLARIEARP